MITVSQSKKDREKIILDRFLKIQNQKFSILSEKEAKEIYPQYNGENPDCIISDGEEYIGVELFSLILANTAGVNPPFVNLAHRRTRFPGIINDLNTDVKAHLDALKQYGLAKQDNIRDILLQEIPDKVGKLPLYCGNKIWLLGYADETYQVKMVKRIEEDHMAEDLRALVFNKIAVPDRIERIILFETEISPNEHIFYLKEEKVPGH